MQVIALIGPSGSGKSHHALMVARDWSASAVVDDGLLIEGSGHIVAGHSAKLEKTLKAAVQRATFADPQHARRVRQGLEALKPERVLVLGTSRAMVETICQRLQLPYPGRWIHITEVASPREIRTARRVRRLEGKHVIPAPTFDVEQSFPRYLLAPLWLVYRRRHPPVPLEKTVVRPTRTHLGRLSISDEVVRALVFRLLSTSPGVGGVDRLQVEAAGGGIVIEADVAVRLSPGMLTTLHRAREQVKRQLEDWTGLSVRSFSLTAARLVGVEHGRKDHPRPQARKAEGLLGRVGRAAGGSGGVPSPGTGSRNVTDPTPAWEGGRAGESSQQPISTGSGDGA